jgi:hypothetical protein
VTFSEFKSLARELKNLIERIPVRSETISSAKARELRLQLQEVALDLRERIAALDSIKLPHSFFDPADPRLFGIFAAVALVGQDRVSMTSLGAPRFYGSGIYAIYYRGEFPPYKKISGTEHPIYVGKADPDEPYGKTAIEQGMRLCGRLVDHKRSISKASDSISLYDFECRYLVVASGWQVAAESALINLFKPLWNKETGVIYGFGKHGDKATTRVHDRSPWDTLHSGRKWAGESEGDAMSIEEINQKIIEHFRLNPVVPDLQHVLQALLAHIKVR